MIYMFVFSFCGMFETINFRAGKEKDIQKVKSYATGAYS
jgi:hypothetical protein